jgi:large subunit ribosomal protein L21
MFAIVKTGGKQYRVAVGDQITVERIEGDVGSHIELAQVLALGDSEAPAVGTPLVAGSSVKARIVQQPRGTKVIVFKKKRRKNYRRKHGHRQDLTVLKIEEISRGA